jgi:hypothetical protein
MTLRDLHANFEHGAIWLDCPCGKQHRIRICTEECTLFTTDRRFHSIGEFPKITIHPAILSACASFSIIDGEVANLVK